MIMLIALVLCVVICLLIGFPVAFGLGGVAILFEIFTEETLLGPYAFRIWGNIMNNQVLVAVPLFVYMGVMLERSGIAERLLASMAQLFGRVRGGLAVSVIVVGALLAASTGIVGATVVTMGLMSLPIMLRHGYSKELATGTIAASGTLGQIIPPSIVLILLGSMLSVSVGDMFKAAMLPGAFLVIAYVVWVLGIAFFRKDAAPAMPRQVDKDGNPLRLTGRLTQLAIGMVPPLILICAVLGSIFAGIATPTESAGVGALGATILTIAYRRMTLKTLMYVMRETAHLTSMVFMILVGAAAFSIVFFNLNGKEVIQQGVTHLGLSPHRLVLVIMLIVFLLGFFIDFIEIIFIIVPIVLPLVAPDQQGHTALDHEHVNKLWFGILMAMNLQTSFLTPPFGFSLFYLKGVAPPEIRTGHIYRGIVPYIVIQLMALLLVYFWPECVTWADSTLKAAAATAAN